MTTIIDHLRCQQCGQPIRQAFSVSTLYVLRDAHTDGLTVYLHSLDCLKQYMFEAGSRSGAAFQRLQDSRVIDAARALAEKSDPYTPFGYTNDEILKLRRALEAYDAIGGE